MVTDTSITLEYSTGTSTDYYKDEPLKLSCQTENKPTGSSVFKNGIKFDDGVNAAGTTGCTIFPAQVDPFIRNLEDVTVLTEIDVAMCEKVKVDPLWSMQLSIQIASKLTSYTMSCYVEDTLISNTTVSQETLKLNAVDIKGKNMKLFNISSFCLKKYLYFCLHIYAPEILKVSSLIS